MKKYLLLLALVRMVGCGHGKQVEPADRRTYTQFCNDLLSLNVAMEISDYNKSHPTEQVEVTRGKVQRVPIVPGEEY